MAEKKSPPVTAKTIVAQPCPHCGREVFVAVQAAAEVVKRG